MADGSLFGTLRCLTLYAGAGGADLGLLAAGVEHVACVDANADCVATLRAAGFPGVRAGIGGPYEDAPAFDPAPFVGVDLVWASPPCQPYSRAGKGLGADDVRDGWPHTLAILATLRPRWAVVENVRGAPVDVWAGELRAIGYQVSHWRMDAADYGVPQNRVREFLIAGPAALPCPRPTHSAASLAWAKWGSGDYWRRHGIAPVGSPSKADQKYLQQLFDPSRALLPWRTMRDVLPGLVAFAPETSRGKGAPPLAPLPCDRPSVVPVAGGHALGGIVGWFDPKHPPCHPDAPASTTRSGGSGHSAPLVYVRTEQVGATARGVDEPAPTVPTVGNQYAHVGDPGCRRSGDRPPASRPELADRPAPTVSAVGECKGSGPGGNPAKLQRASDVDWLAAGRRRLTVEECATLCAFPDGYPFQGNKTARYRQVGNCVVPPVAEVIGRAVAEAQLGASP